MSGQGEYNVDIVMCIDATGSMAPIINKVKENALTFYSKFDEAMEDQDKWVDNLRVKVIVFKDYICDTNPMVESRFFTLPKDSADFENFVNKIEPTGGGDTPENSLEAISLALKSDWTTNGGRFRRHVIVVFTDAPALPLQERRDCPGYPAGMPKNLAELGDWWQYDEQEGLPFDGTYNSYAGRLIVFAPEASPWTDMKGWSRYWYMKSKAGTGLAELDMQAVLALLAGSV